MATEDKKLRRINQPQENDSKEENTLTNSENQPDKNIESKILAETVLNIDKDIYFTAATASKKTAGVIKKRVEVMLLSVYEKINSAINQGLYSVICELNKEQREFLSVKGFRISLKSGGNNGVYQCVISWN